jgi:glucosamine 6-phosphate synthetase-like amidotransferase/phosphosugar isomerase protein
LYLERERAMLGEGKSYEFTDDEGGMYTYYCKKDSGRLPIDVRAQKAFAYYTEKRRENLIAITQGFEEGNTSEFTTHIVAFRQKNKALQSALVEKYSCMIVRYMK